MTRSSSDALAEPSERSRRMESLCSWLHQKGLRWHEPSFLRAPRLLSWGLWMSLASVSHPVGKRKPIATLMRLWAWQVWRRLVNCPVVTEVEGCSLICPPWSNLASSWISVGLHEYREMTFALHLVRREDLVIDVGANLGVYCVLLARRGARVWAFEPDPSARQILRANLRLNDVHQSVVIEEVALSDASGDARFTVDKESSNHLVTSASADFSTVVVQARRLDDYLEGLPGAFRWQDMTFMKVDAEGFDLNVLKGAERLLMLAKPALCVETWSGGHEIRRWLQAKGYSTYLYNPDLRRLWWVPDDYNKQANFIAIHKDKFAWVLQRLGSGRPLDVERQSVTIDARRRGSSFSMGGN